MIDAHVHVWTDDTQRYPRASGERQGLFWQWEIKSVNGKALDVRLRLPQGFEALEAPVRAVLASSRATRSLRRARRNPTIFLLRHFQPLSCDTVLPQIRVQKNRGRGTVSRSLQVTVSPT